MFISQSLCHIYYITFRPSHVISTIEAIINEARSVPAQLPNIQALKEALSKAKDWLAQVDALQSADHYPYLELLEELVNKGKPIPVRLELLTQVTIPNITLTNAMY